MEGHNFFFLRFWIAWITMRQQIMRIIQNLVSTTITLGEVRIENYNSDFRALNKTNSSFYALVRLN